MRIHLTGGVGILSLRKDEAPEDTSRPASLLSRLSRHLHLLLSSKGTFTYVITFNPHDNRKGSIFSLHLQVRKLRFSKVKQNGQGHTGSHASSQNQTCAV